MVRDSVRHRIVAAHDFTPSLNRTGLYVGYCHFLAADCGEPLRSSFCPELDSCSAGRAEGGNYPRFLELAGHSTSANLSSQPARVHMQDGRLEASHQPHLFPAVRMTWGRLETRTLKYCYQDSDNPRVCPPYSVVLKNHETQPAYEVLVHPPSLAANPFRHYPQRAPFIRNQLATYIHSNARMPWR